MNKNRKVNKNREFPCRRGTTTIITITTEFLVAEAGLKIQFLTILRLYSQGRRKGDPNINVVGKNKK